MDNPLTIAEFTDNYGPAASGLLYAVQFLEGQALKAGHRVLLVAPECDGPNPYADEKRRREIRLPSMNIPGMHVRLALGQDFDYRLAQITANPPDVIHVHGLGPIGLLGMWAAQRTGKPLLLTWHTDFEAYADHYWHLAPLLNAAYKVLEEHVNKTWSSVRHTVTTRPKRGRAQVELLQVAAQMLTDADLVTTPSDKTGKRVLEIAPEARVRVLPNGVEPIPDAPPIPKAPGPRLLYVGRISAEKGIDLLLDAFALIRDRIPDAELMIVGDWKQAPVGLRTRLARDSRFGHVKLPGLIPREELGAYYESADVFVFPSITDTQALVLHEAAHAGLPLVMCDSELRLVADPGVNALFARPNAVSLSQTIMRMLHALQDPDFKSRAQARSRELAGQYTVEKQSAEVIGLYEDLAAGRPIALTPNLNPDLGRQPFPGRKVTAHYEPPTRED
ncbi:MAG: glycosyltransferase [Propionibacteriaceae bacterium]|nr:glycosyltransferase [Propionibacteriaceae bacterium]